MKNAEKAAVLLPDECLLIRFTNKGEGERLLQFNPKGSRFKKLIRGLNKIKL